MVINSIWAKDGGSVKKVQPPTCDCARDHDDVTTYRFRWESKDDEVAADRLSTVKAV